MFEALKRFRAERDERGFTLIELMVVVLIIAILIAIAIPTFLGARTKAQDRAAQSDLRTGLVTAQAFYTDNETYSAVVAANTPVEYQADEPSIDFDAAADASVAAMVGGGKVGVYDFDADSVALVKLSKSGEYFCVGQTTSTATVFGRDALLTAVDTVTECGTATDW